jgi:hypothetical protein
MAEMVILFKYLKFCWKYCIVFLSNHTHKHRDGVICFMDAINLATREGLQKYLQNAPLNELQEIASKLKVEFNDLPGETTEDKSRELIAYVDRRKQFPELTLATMRSYVTKQLLSEEKNNSDFTTSTISAQSSLAALNLQINSLHEQVEELRRNPRKSHALENKLEELARTAETANKLTASVVLPSPESMAVHLAPIYQLDHLREYQSDENWAFLLIGAFSGAILGIISNWATNENFVLTRFSIVLIVIFGVLTILTVVWAIQLKRRTKTFINELISNTNSSFGSTGRKVSKNEPNG